MHSEMVMKGSGLAIASRPAWSRAFHCHLMEMGPGACTGSKRQWKGSRGCSGAMARSDAAAHDTAAQQRRAAEVHLGDEALLERQGDAAGALLVGPLLHLRLHRLALAV